MNQHQPEKETVSTVELLLSRIVDAEANDADWAAFRAAAAADETLWRTLAEAQAAQQDLVMALTPTLEAADKCALPRPAENEHDHTLLSLRRWPAWSGWAVAALVAVMWWVNGWAGLNLSDHDDNRADSTAGIFNMPKVAQAATTPNDLLQGYLRSDHVLGQGPLQLLKTMETKEGTQVVVLRPIYEKLTLDPVYQPLLDETGRVVPRRVPRQPVELVNSHL